MAVAAPVSLATVITTVRKSPTLTAAGDTLMLAVRLVASCTVMFGLVAVVLVTFTPVFASVPVTCDVRLKTPAPVARYV